MLCFFTTLAIGHLPLLDFVLRVDTHIENVGRPRHRAWDSTSSPHYAQSRRLSLSYRISAAKRLRAFSVVHRLCELKSQLPFQPDAGAPLQRTRQRAAM